MAAAKRRASVATPVTLVRTTSANTSNSVVFATAAAAGQLVLIVSFRPASATPNTAEAGFTDIFVDTATVASCLSAHYKVAGGSESTTYTMDAGGNARHVGYILDGVGASPIVGFSSNSDNGTVTSLACGSSNIDVVDGAFVIAAHGRSAGSAVRSFSNSFGDEIAVGANRLTTAHRIYSAAAGAQNSTASWSGGESAVRGAIIQVRP